MDGRSAIAIFGSILPLVVVIGGLRLGARWIGDRRLGGRGQYRLFVRALRSGEVPEDAERGTWSALLATQFDKEQRRRWYAWIPSVAVVGLIVWVNVTSVLDDGETTTTGKVITLLATLALLTLYSGCVAWVARRGSRRRRVLLDRLRGVERTAS
ncbi:hypothetical protein [Aeromicrobium sp.]|uniref:hypothetical protein n=1 Tax=Aeromicrobium sp. TaxID=1871063 RepID=UPI0030C049CC